MSLMLQPELAFALFESRTLAGQGFLSRCLPAFPQSTIGHRPHKIIVPDNRLDRFFDAQDKLLLIPPNMNLETGELQLKNLPLDDEAMAAWVEHYNSFEKALNGKYSAIQEVANKAPEQIQRIAGVRAGLEGCDRVNRQQIDDAAKLMQWHCREWLTISSRLVAHRKEVALPQELLTWMRHSRAKTGKSIFNLRDVYSSGPRIVRNQADQAKQLLMELVRRGYVRIAGKDYELRPESNLG